MRYLLPPFKRVTQQKLFFDKSILFWLTSLQKPPNLFFHVLLCFFSNDFFFGHPLGAKDKGPKLALGDIRGHQGFQMCHENMIFPSKSEFVPRKSIRSVGFLEGKHRQMSDLSILETRAAAAAATALMC